MTTMCEWINRFPFVTRDEKNKKRLGNSCRKPANRNQAFFEEILLFLQE